MKNTLDGIVIDTAEKEKMNEITNIAIELSKMNTKDK